jgi:serine phosphatase RsbU (regulator of sigma subunit)
LILRSRYIFGVIAFLGIFVFSSHKEREDSIRQELRKKIPDTTRAISLSNLGLEYKRSNGDSARKYGQQALLLSEKINFLRGKSLALNLIGISFHFQGGYDSALFYYEKALACRKVLNDTASMASVISNMGIIHFIMGDYDQALRKHEQAKKFQLQKKDTAGLANTYNNLASVYRYQGRHEKALEYFTQAYRYYKKSGNGSGALFALNNMALMYGINGNRDLAIETYLEGIELASKENDLYILSVFYTNLGVQYLELKQPGQALHFFKEGFQASKKINNLQGLATISNNLARAYLETEEFGEALRYSKSAEQYFRVKNEMHSLAEVLTVQSEIYHQLKNYEKEQNLLLEILSISEKVGLREQKSNCLKQLYGLCLSTNKQALAAEYFGAYTRLKDSLLRSGGSKEMNEMQTAFEAEKKENKIELLEKENALHLLSIENQKSAIKKQNLFLASSAALIILVTGFGFLLYYSINEKKKQQAKLASLNHQIESKKNQAEKIHGNLIRQLQFGYELQKSFLPDLTKLKNPVRKSFLLYKPKEKIGGDFYYVKEFTGYTLLAVVDCTGHGVPGAYMSFLAYEMLEQLTRLQENHRPEALLTRLNQILFEKHSLYGNDVLGMDISIINLPEENGTGTYAACRQPLWIRKQDNPDKLSSLKTEKKILGLSGETTFREITFSKAPGDQYYLFSDGFADQKGEATKKKISQEKIMKTLSKSGLRFQQQENDLRELLLSWMGETEQTDDITFLGLSV